MHPQQKHRQTDKQGGGGTKQIQDREKRKHQGVFKGRIVTWLQHKPYKLTGLLTRIKHLQKDASNERGARILKRLLYII